MCEICSKLTIKTPERRQWRRSGFFVFNFEQILDIVLELSLLNMNKGMPDGLRSAFCFEKRNYRNVIPNIIVIVLKEIVLSDL